MRSVPTRPASKTFTKPAVRASRSEGSLSALSYPWSSHSRRGSRKCGERQEGPHSGPTRFADTPYIFHLADGGVAVDMALLADPNGIPPGARLSGRLGRDGLIETRIFKRMVFPADDIVRIEARPGGERRCGGDASAKPAPGPESGVAARARQLLNQPLGGYSAYLFILSDGRHVPIHSYTCSGSEPLFRLSATLTGPDMTTIEARYVGGSETFDIGAIVAIHEDGL